MKPVSLIIPNWNGADLLSANLPSVIAAQKAYQSPSEVIVVDDASADHSTDLLRRDFPAVRLVMHESNKGFGKACWSGALAAEHPILIFLNSDVRVALEFIAPLVRYFEDPDVFAASPLIFNEDGSLTNGTIAIPYFHRGKIRYRRFDTRLLLKNAPRLPSAWLTLFPIGAAFAADRCRFLNLNGFDDLFKPFYYEDTDLGLRAWRRGWKCCVVPESHVIHYHAGTIARSFKKFRVSALRKRNRLYFLWKNLTARKLLCQHLLHQILRLCYRPFCLDGMTHIATMLAIPGFMKAMRRRGEENQQAVYSEEKIFEMITAACEKNCRVLASDGSNVSTPKPGKPQPK